MATPSIPTSSRKRKRYILQKKTFKKFRGSKIPELSAGMQGILITTNDKEKMCVSEAYNLLNEYADKLYGSDVSDHSTSDEKEEEDEKDVSEALVHEVTAIKSRPKKRFNAALTGVKNIVFIECDPSIDPCYLVHHLLCDIRDNGIQKTRFCLRMIPVTTVCYASVNSIKKVAATVISPHFHADESSSIEFSVHCKIRNNQSVSRDSLIDLFATLVTDDGAYYHCVNLKQPTLVVCVEVLKNLCCLSVLKDFYELKQYNVKSVALKVKEHSHLPSHTASSAEDKPSSSSVTDTVESQDSTHLQENEKPKNDALV